MPERRARDETRASERAVFFSSMTTPPPTPPARQRRLASSRPRIRRAGERGADGRGGRPARSQHGGGRRAAAACVARGERRRAPSLEARGGTCARRDAHAAARRARGGMRARRSARAASRPEAAGCSARRAPRIARRARARRLSGDHSSFTPRRDGARRRVDARRRGRRSIALARVASPRTRASQVSTRHDKATQWRRCDTTVLEGNGGKRGATRERTYAPARQLGDHRVARRMVRRRAQQLGDGRVRRLRRRSAAAVRLHRRRCVAGALLRPAPGPRRKWRRPFRLGAVDRSAQHLDVDLTRQLAALHRAERTCEGRRGRWTHTDHHDRRSLATRCDPSFFLSLSPSPHAPRIAPRGR